MIRAEPVAGIAQPRFIVISASLTWRHLPTEYGLGQTTDLAPDDAWDVVAKDVEDLAAALGA